MGVLLLGILFNNMLIFKVIIKPLRISIFMYLFMSVFLMCLVRSTTSLSWKPNSLNLYMSKRFNLNVTIPYMLETGKLRQNHHRNRLDLEYTVEIHIEMNSLLQVKSRTNQQIRGEYPLMLSGRSPSYGKNQHTS